MRENDNPQMPLAPSWGKHERAGVLAKLSDVLDEHPELSKRAGADVRALARATGAGRG